MEGYKNLRSYTAAPGASAQSGNSAETKAHHGSSLFDGIRAQLKHVRPSGNSLVSLCPVSAHDDQHRSFSVRLIENVILLHCFAGCSLAAICAALGIQIRDLFLGPGNHSNSSSAQYYSDQQRLDYAREHFWRPSRVAWHTIVEAYLRSRKITGPLPPVHRFIPLLPHREYGWPFPAMVAGIQSVDGRFAGVQVTWLCADGTDKAPVEPVRKTYGPHKGGAVRLSSQLDTQIAVGEGIETMMSVKEASGIVCWAALAATNLAQVEVPATVRKVIVCADPDPAGEAAAEVCARRLLNEKREARLAHTGRPGRDFNDIRN